jgi:kumamolisin
MTKNKNTEASSASTNGGQPFDPITIAKLYAFPTSLDGSNQCIGILEFGGGFTNSDLVSYFSNRGLPTSGPDGTGLHSPGVDVEVLLDIEVVASIGKDRSLLC